MFGKGVELFIVDSVGREWVTGSTSIRSRLYTGTVGVVCHAFEGVGVEKVVSSISNRIHTCTVSSAPVRVTLLPYGSKVKSMIMPDPLR